MDVKKQAQEAKAARAAKKKRDAEDMKIVNDAMSHGENLHSMGE
tara:strand:+ start:303 stop:434 length:132 start_codon:yes stop_codon:yes gene_type:complete